MKRLWTVLALLLATNPTRAATELPGPVCVIKIHEDISHNTLYLVRRGLNEAAGKRAAAVVLDMDTNGGRVDATEEIIRLLEHAPMKTYTLVSQKAYSAGAYIAAATDKIFMAPGSVIGAATPIMLIPGSGVAELPKSYEEKITSAMRALIRSTAQQKNHNPEVFEAMVDADRGLTVDGKEITPKGKLLTLTNEEAAKEYGKPPKPLLSAGTLTTVDELLGKIGLTGAETFTVVPAGFEVLGRWLTMIGPMLMLIGFVAIYMELKAPGLGVPTLVAVVAFGLYFFGYYAAGMAGWEVMALFLVGLVLVALEIFVIPGFGVAGVAGLGAILISLVLAMTERWPGGPIWPAWDKLQTSLLTVGGTFFCSLAVMAVLARWLPRTRLYQQMELNTVTGAETGYTTASGAAKSLLGTTGLAETNLRPAGKGRFDKQLVDVVTEGDLIEKGASIKIVEVQGSRVVVTRG